MSEHDFLDQKGFELSPSLEHDPQAAAIKLRNELPQMTAAEALTVARMANVGVNNENNTFVLGIPSYHSCHTKSANLYVETFDAKNDKRSFIPVGNLHFKSNACTATNFGIPIEAIPDAEGSIVGQSKEMTEISDTDYAALENNIATGKQWTDSSVRTLKSIVQNQIIGGEGTVEDIHRLLDSTQKELNHASDSRRLGWIETQDPQSGQRYVYAVLQVSEPSINRDLDATKSGLETPTARLVGTFPPPKSI